MTTAVCFKCGEFKHGAFTPCQKCRADPVSDDDLALSLAMTDHYCDLPGLQAMSLGAKRGKPPHLSPETRELLLKVVRSHPEILRRLKTKPQKPWWKRW